MKKIYESVTVLVFDQFEGVVNRFGICGKLPVFQFDFCKVTFSVEMWF